MKKSLLKWLPIVVSPLFVGSQLASAQALGPIAKAAAGAAASAGTKLILEKSLSPSEGKNSISGNLNISSKASVQQVTVGAGAAHVGSIEIQSSTVKGDLTIKTDSQVLNAAVGAGSANIGGVELSKVQAQNVHIETKTKVADLNVKAGSVQVGSVTGMGSKTKGNINISTDIKAQNVTVKAGSAKIGSVKF